MSFTSWFCRTDNASERMQLTHWTAWDSWTLLRFYMAKLGGSRWQGLGTGGGGSPSSRSEGRRKWCLGYMPGVFTHLPSERKEMVCASDYVSKPFPQKGTVERVQPQNGSMQNCIKASFIPSHTWDRKAKINTRSYPLLDAASLSCQEVLT